MKILVVDDRKDDRESLVELLTTLGYETAGAADGREAMAHMRQHETDLALLDIIMPKPGGIEVLRELKQQQPELEVILVTAYATLEKAVAGLKEGAYDFLAKPCAADAIIAAVERVREKKGLQANIKNSEERLRKSERFLHSVLESLGDAVVVIGRDMRIISANQGYRRQTKMEDDEILGRHCYRVSHGFSRPCYLVEDGCACAVTETFRDGAPHTAIHTHRDKEGNPLYVETNSYPLRDENGRVNAVVEAIRDITHLKKLEEGKKSIEAQLLQAHKMEAVGQLAGGSATQLIQGLLAFSRRQLIRPEPLDLAELLEKTRKMVEKTIRADIALKIIMPPNPLPVMADRSQLQQVILNLAANARDAMPEGGELIIEGDRARFDREYIEHHGYGREGEYIRLTLTDNGQGMDQRTREKIFEPFFSTKELGQGTGLGLAMVYGIIKQHQGYINVYSEPGQGSVFKIYLPAYRAADETQPERETEDEPEHPRGAGETILLADDAPAIRKAVGIILENAGYRVLTAADGQEALAVFNAHQDQIALVILDVIMPKADGKAVFEQIQRTRPDARVLFFSGYTDNIMQRKGIPGQEFNFLAKPVTPQQLLHKVRQLLDG